MAKIFPSLISGDLLNLKKQIKELDPHCDGYHVDVMDDHFVPNLTWGAQFINAIAATTKKPLFIHLMVEHPEVWPSRLTLSENSTICFHIESTFSPELVTRLITEKNIEPAISIKPSTPIEEIIPTLEYIHHVLLMSVEPGFSGKQFLPESVTKLNELTHAKDDQKLSFSISMDGGIGIGNIRMLNNLGVDMFGIGSAIFNSNDPVENIKNLKKELT